MSAATPRERALRAMGRVHGLPDDKALRASLLTEIEAEIYGAQIDEKHRLAGQIKKSGRAYRS